MAIKLTPKREQFIREYLIDANATQAAIRAGYSPRTAASQGERLLRNVEIKARVAEGHKRLAEKAEVDASWVLERLVVLADFSVGKFMRTAADGHCYLDLSEATEADWYCIDEYTVDTIGRGQGVDQISIDRVKIKPISKIRALELLGRHKAIGAWEDKQTITHLDGRAKRLEAARARVANLEKGADGMYRSAN